MDNWNKKFQEVSFLSATGVNWYKSSATGISSTTGDKTIYHWYQW